MNQQVSPDDWKGEHLIRNIKPASIQGIRPDIVRTFKTRTCGVPGCEVHLASKNISGCCKAHSHAVGVCQCKACKAAS